MVHLSHKDCMDNSVFVVKKSLAGMKDLLARVQDDFDVVLEEDDEAANAVSAPNSRQQQGE